MNTSGRLLTLGLLSVFCGMFLAPQLARAQEWQPITDEDLKVTSQQEGNADAIILYHELSADDNLKSRYVYRRVKILREKGKQYADVEIPFSKEGRKLKSFFEKVHANDEEQVALRVTPVAAGK